MTQPNASAYSHETVRSPHGCDGCGRLPARQVSYSGVTGLLLARRHWRIEVFACRACSRGVFRSAQSRLLITGWWSLIAFIVTPFLLFVNTGRFYDHRRHLPEADVRELDEDAELEGRSLLLRVGPILIAGLLAIVLLNSVFG